MAELTLQLRDLDDVGKDYHFTLSTAWMEQVLAGCALRPAGGTGSLTVHAQVNDRDVLITGHVRADLIAECARCLGDVPCRVDTDVVAMLSPMPGASRHRDKDEDDVELSEEDTYRAHYSGAEIVLDELIREHLILEVPMQPVCEANCQGIPVPEHIRPPREIFESSAVDPRLAPLLKFKDKVPRNKE
jgi:uncharacterized protein